MWVSLNVEEARDKQFESFLEPWGEIILTTSPRSDVYFDQMRMEGLFAFVLLYSCPQILCSGNSNEW